MKIRLSNIIATAIVALSCTSAVHASARRALVIGNDSYPGNELHNARNDAKSVASALKHDGYQATLMLDVNRQKMINGIARFADTISPGDAVIVYYAGHGLQVSGENYMVPTDFKVTSPGDVKNEGYSISSLLELLTAHGATTQVLILDACRDNPFLGTRSLHGGWAGIGTSAGTFIAFGTSPGSTASDDPRAPHGLFTLELLKYLSSSHLDIEQMFQKVRLDVIRASHGQQVPWTASSLVGTFHILPQYDETTAPLPDSAGELAMANTPDWPSRSYEQARRDARRITSLTAAQTTQTVPSSLQARAISEIENSKFESAADDLRKVLAGDPSSPLAANLLVLALESAGDDAEAGQVMNREIETQPSDSDALINRCILEARVGSSVELADCEAAVRAVPDSAEAHLALANALYVLGQNNRAYSEVTRAIQISPDAGVAFALRGRIAAAEGYQGLAKQDFKRAVRISLKADATGN